MLAIIGGSGFYQMEGAKASSQEMSTPFGAPSAAITSLTFADGRRALFLPRHGPAHQLLPSEINYRANIWALKKAGARQIIAVSACGSLREEIRPGDFAIPSQYFDHTRGRTRTFFGDGLVGHVSSAKPACPLLSAALAEACEKLGFAIHSDKNLRLRGGAALGDSRRESIFAGCGGGGHCGDDQRAGGFFGDGGADKLCNFGGLHRLRLLEGRPGGACDSRGHHRPLRREHCPRASSGRRCNCRASANRRTTSPRRLRRRAHSPRSPNSGAQGTSKSSSRLIHHVFWRARDTNFLPLFLFGEYNRKENPGLF